MSRYSLLVSLHVASVIVWLGGGTTLAFLTFYAQRAKSVIGFRQLASLTHWASLWLLAPASIAAAGFGVAAAHAGGWSDIFFFHVGEGAFLLSFFLTGAIRIPLVHRSAAGAVSPDSLSRYLLALAVVELSALYLAVAAMVAKPAGGDSSVRWGAALFAAAVVVAAVIAIRARSLATRPSKSEALAHEPGLWADSRSLRR